MEKIAIFGGTFDPVHKEHIEMATAVIKELNLDKLIVMPTFSPPHKTHSESASATDRYNMLCLAFDGLPVEISDYEIVNGGKSYTYKTVEHFAQLYKNVALYFIVGDDMLTDFKTWRFPERILDKATLAVFGREGQKADYDGEKEYFERTFGKRFLRLNYVGKDLSSTKIRVYNAFCLPIDGLTSPKVAEYISEKCLYAGGTPETVARINLPKKRLKHTANVVITALKKEKVLSLNREKVITACALHDVAKYMDEKNFPQGIIPADMPAPVRHAFLGEYYARETVGITDPDVLNAIKYHTSGRPNMSLLEKIVFVADMIEEDRDYDGVDVLRKSYEEDDFETCFRLCLKEEMLHLKNKNAQIYQETINAYEYYIKEKNL